MTSLGYMTPCHKTKHISLDGMVAYACNLSIRQSEGTGSQVPASLVFTVISWLAWAIE